MKGKVDYFTVWYWCFLWVSLEGVYWFVGLLILVFVELFGWLSIFLVVYWEWVGFYATNNPFLSLVKGSI